MAWENETLKEDVRGSTIMDDRLPRFRWAVT